MQYPAVQSITYLTGIVSFIDGSDQRYRDYSQPLRRWIIRLSLLADSELEQLDTFFSNQEGQYGTFSFTDPWTSIEYPDCSIDVSALPLYFVRENRGEGTLIVMENRL